MLLTSPNLPLVFSQNDNVVLTLIATDTQGNPVTLTGATFSTQILGPNNTGAVTFPNAQHTANADQVNFKGYFTLTLGTADTGACAIGENKDIVTAITISGNVASYQGLSILEVLPNVPTQ